MVSRWVCGNGYDQQMGVWEGVRPTDRCGKRYGQQIGVWEGVRPVDRCGKGYDQQSIQRI